MRSPRQLFTTIAFTTLAATALLAQTAAPTPHLRAALAAQPNQRTIQALSLTDAQVTQARAIYQDAHTASRSVAQSLRQQRLATRAAIQAGKSPDEVQQLGQSEGQLLGQLEGIHAAAEAKFHAILTPDQQQKFAAMNQHGKAGAARLHRAQQ